LFLPAPLQPSRVRGGLPHIADFSGAAALDRFDVVRLPRLVEPWLKRSVEAQDHETALGRASARNFGECH
jgi:hypothetical protein